MRNNQLGNARAEKLWHPRPGRCGRNAGGPACGKRVLTLPLYADLFMEDVGPICKIILEQKL